jgi:hypothetical protein
VKLPIELINTYNLLKSNMLSNDICIEHVNSMLKQINSNNQSKSFSLKSLGIRKYSTFSSDNYIKEDEEILEKRMLEILENHDFEDDYCPLRFCDENGATPD